MKVIHFVNVIHEEPQRGGRRARARKQRVEEILSTALTLVEEQGLEALTVQALARRMDWAAGALYRYYAGKDALFAALQTRVISEYGEALHSALEGAFAGARADDADAALEALAFTADHYRAYAEANPTRFRMISLSLGEPRELLDDARAGRVMQSGLSLLGVAAARLSQAADIGALAPGDGLARTLIFWSTVQGVLLMRKLQRLAPEVIDIDALFVDAVITLLCGWGADRQRAQAAVQRAWARRAGATSHEIDRPTTPSDDGAFDA